MLALLLSLFLSTAHAIEAKDAPCRWNSDDRVIVKGSTIVVGDNGYVVDRNAANTVEPSLFMLDAEACGSKSVKIYTIEYAVALDRFYNSVVWSVLLLVPVVNLPSAMSAKNKAAENLKAAIVEAGKTHAEVAI